MGPLEERHGPDGITYLLDGEPVEDGITIDMLLPAGRWLTGAYRVVDRRVVFAFAVGGEWERSGDPPMEAIAIVVPRATIFRRLEERRSRES